MQKGFALIFLLVGMVIVIVIAGSVYYFTKIKPYRYNSFIEECKVSGGSVLESYPPLCQTPDGKTFKLREKIIAKTTSIANPSLTTINTLSPTMAVNKKTIHLAPFYGVDASISINKLNIIGVMFVPKNITKQIKPEWSYNMDKIFARIKKFYEAQFEGNIEITYQVNSAPIKGEENIEDYYPEDFVEEIENKNQNLLKSNTHNVWMIYLVEDPNFKLLVKGGGNLGGLARLNASTQGEFWLDNDAAITGTYGITGSAHEFGHALGIPHPWDLSININHDPNFGNVPGDIMGYSPYPDLDKNYIRDDIKKVMGL